MACMVLNRLYGRDTRPVLVSSIVINILLLLAVFANALQVIDFVIPKSLEHDPTMFMGLTIVAALVGWLAPWASNSNRQVFKSFTYLVSAVIQVILANGFVSDSPPLSLMLLVSTALSAWFLGAAVYVLKCEGLNGDYSKRSRV